MQTIRIHPQAVILIGAGRGGSALLEMFISDELVVVLGVVDANPEAPGMRLARQYGIPTYADAQEVVHLCEDHPQCIVYNLTHSDNLAGVLGKIKITSGFEAKFFWQVVTNLQQVKQELENNQNQLQAVIKNAMDGIVTIDQEGKVEGFNPAAEQIFGYAHDEAIGRHVEIFVAPEVREEYLQQLAVFMRDESLRKNGLRGHEVVAMRKNGTTFPMEISASEMQLGGKCYFVAIVRDITERKQTEQRINFLAHHDYLTGLPNRALFMDRLEQAVCLARRNKQLVALFFMDLDGFKKINDTLGHDAGDLLLKGVAQRLKSTVRTSDTIARLGGDEFVVVLHNVANMDSATEVASKIITSLGETFNLDGQLCNVGCSIGISIYPQDASDSATLIKQADESMYLSKQRGKNTYTCFTKSCGFGQ